MKNSSNNSTTFIKMATNEESRKQFNDRMVDLTWRYQKKYGFEVRDKKNNEFWNNEADAFKHTYGSALMEFEMGGFGSLIGGVHHEYITENNPTNEWNMDSWNNDQGRKIAQDIKNEYGEKNFRNFSKEKQENIIAAKVMAKMRNGELITHPEDKRVFCGVVERVLKFSGDMRDKNKERERQKNKTQNDSSNHSILNFKGIEINGKTWDELSDETRAAFWEGFDSNTLSSNNQNNWTKDFNVGNAAQDEGHWVTMPNKKHLFIKDT